MAATTRAEPSAPPGPSRTDDAATAVLERWQKVQGLDRPAAAVFPRLSVQQVFSGDATRGWKIRLVENGFEYRVVVDPPEGKRYGEIAGRDGPGYWHIGEDLGVGRVPHRSERVDFLTQYRWSLPAVRRKYPWANRLADRDRDGRKCQVLDLQGMDGAHEFWWFDADTGVLLVVDKVSIANELRGRIRFGDFRTVDGVLEPFEMIEGEGATRTTRRLESVQNHISVPANFFEVPKEERALWNAAEDVLLKYIKASGGYGALARIVSRVTKSVGETSAGSTFEMTVTEKSPSSFLAERFDPGIGRTWRGFDGEHGWELSELQGFRALPPAEIEFLRRNGQLNTENCNTLFVFRRIMGRRDLNGRNTVAIALTTSSGGAGVHYFDVETGRLLRIDGHVVGPDGDLPLRLDFSDFRVVDGVTLPFEIRQSNPAFTITTRVQSVEHNLPLDPAIFHPRKLD